MPRVSIIMGVYNGQQKVSEAIQSVLNQTYEDWEFIICDDCSSDETRKVLEEWQKREPRIRILCNAENRKLAATLNRCLSIAKGSYIARMDDDDYSYPERLEEQVEFLDKHPEFGFVSSLVDCFDGTDIVKNRFYRKAEPQKEDFLSGTQFVHPATVFRKEILEAAGGYRETKETRRTEDYDLFMRLYALGYKGYNIQKPLLRYYVAPQAMQTKRKYIYRIDEAKVRWRGFQALGLMPKGLIYVARPLIVGLIPQWVMWKVFYRR